MGGQLRQLLVNAGERVLAPLSALCDGADLALTVTDADGLILLQHGAEQRLAASARSGILPGTRWAELDVGTNGIGMALTARQTMQVFAAEHYCEAFHDLTCTAAVVVRHPLTGQVLGALDVTAAASASTSNVWAFTTQSAALLEREVRELLLSRDRQLLEALTTVQDGLAAYAIDLRGRRTMGNRGATALVQPDDYAALWGYVQRALADPAQRVVPFTLHSGRAALVQICPVLLGDEPVGALVVLRERGRGERPMPSGAAAEQDWSPFSPAAPWLAAVRAVVRSTEPVLIIGEVGAGKSALALAVRRNHGSGPLISVDCASVGLRALEAACKRATAAGAAGLLLLERLLDLPSHLQARLVAWLDAAPGLNRPWVVATASVAAEADLRASGLRPDLLERLSANLIRVPPLRERADEIARIAAEVLVELEPAVFRLPEPIADDALRVLASYSWPGNVRQLQNVLRRAVLASPRAPVELKALPPEVVAGAAAPPLGRIEQLEVEAILTTLRATGNNVTRAAELVGLSRATLYRRLRAYHTRQRSHPT